MVKNEEFEGDHLTGGHSFFQLPFGDDDNDDVVDLGMESMDQILSCISSSENPPTTLCFGNDKAPGEQLLLPETNGTPQKSIITSYSNSLSDSKKRNETEQQPDLMWMETIPTATVGSQAPQKNTTSENTTSKSRPMMRKIHSACFLGERIAALQQLVSPHGKTDTASILHEAKGYIRFLHDQIEGDGDDKAEAGETINRDLRGRGLRLIPVESTLHVANDSGADFWPSTNGD